MKSGAGLLDQVAQKPFVIRGYEARSPLFFRNFKMNASIYSVPTHLVADWLPHDGSKIMEIVPGRAAIALHCMEYPQTDIGPYNEVSLSLALSPSGLVQNSWIQAARSVLTGGFHTYVADLPVTTEIAVWGGIDVFGYPKRLLDITFRETQAHRICTVRDPGTMNLILEVESSNLRLKPWRAQRLLRPAQHRVLELRTHSQKSGDQRSKESLLACMRVLPGFFGMSFKPWATTLRVGTIAAVGRLGVLAHATHLASLGATQCDGVMSEPEVMQWPG